MAISMQASVAHMVAKLLARRVTAEDEIPVLMRAVESALRALENPPQAELDEPESVHLQQPRHRRPRPTRIHKTSISDATPPVPVPPPLLAPPAVPRLVRRGELAASRASEKTPHLETPPPSRVLRGIVKWFDQRTRRGALRLPGCADEVPVEPGLLEDMGLTRLYKGQEIEATLGDDPTSRVLRLAIPGGVWQVHPTGGVVRNRHHARPVVVELKREALRRVAARVEAEQLLGPTRAR